MAKVKSGVRGGGVAKGLLSLVAQEQQAQAELAKEEREFKRRLQLAGITSKDLEVTAEGRVAKRQVQPFDRGAIGPGQKFVESVGGGTLTTTGPDRVDPLLSQLIAGGAPPPPGAAAAPTSADLQPVANRFQPTGFTAGGIQFGLAPEIEARQKGQVKATTKEFENVVKLGGAVRQLAVLRRQFEEAFPSGDRTPFQQRIAGMSETIGAKFGFTDNPKAVALQKNARLEAIQLIRAFGEVGNLSQSEQRSAIDAINQAGLTSEERTAAVAQVAEFALGRLSEEARNFLLQDPEIASIVQSLGINPSGTNLGQKADPLMQQLQAQFPGATIQEVF